MSYDLHLSERIELILKQKKIHFVSKKMFGGICYMVDDKMCLGVHKDSVMARVGADAYEEALKEAGAAEMKITGRPLKGFVFVGDEGIDTEEQLEHWVDLCLAFNPFAKASKKKKKKK